MNPYKLKALKELEVRFRDLLEEYKPVVMGQGNPEAEIVMIGEAPGRHEVEKGTPFVGQAGRNLDQFLKAAGLERKDLYITNAVKFRPTRKNRNTGRVSNRAPTRKEIKMFRPLLVEEIKIVDPWIVVTLGNIPLFFLTGKNLKIGDVHGEPLPYGQRVIFPLYHPASVIYNPDLKQVYLKDLKKLKDYLMSKGKI